MRAPRRNILRLPRCQPAPIVRARMQRTLGFVIALAAAVPSSASVITMEDRVSAQRAIEEVFWRHRIWPKDNPAPKPSLDTVMPERAVRAKVADWLKKSSALAAVWHRPITGEQLQAELDRMARGSRDRHVLQELFDALHGDSELVAETLVRPVLVERLARNWYANDDRFVGATRRKAEKALAACHDVTCMKELGGRYVETTMRLERETGTARPEIPIKPEVRLDAEQWKDQLGRLASRLGGSPELISTCRLSPLEETDDTFSVTALLSQSDDELLIATTLWPKPTFDDWWSAERGKQPANVESTGRPPTLPVLDPSACTNDTWTPTATEIPDPRYGQTAVWTGTEMIVWGGGSDGYGLNTGGRYNPATDTWAPTSTGINSPPSSGLHTAVWTGTEMIVWGGRHLDYATGNLIYQGSGARYKPSTDAWTPISTSAGAVPARAYHTAVWTGTEMIIWGGFRPGGPNPPGGGRYRPATDSWAPVSQVNAAERSLGHTTVWTGTEMIVWGGTSDSSGGRYDPIADTWTQTSAGAGVPSPRSDHTAMWTGTEMIVWGGRDNGNGPALNTGARYNPSSDAWSATSIGANVPSARSLHTVVWTGSRMVVWGGLGATGSGAIYDPIGNSWIPTSGTVLTPRFAHTAVWTGTEMIVWGGTGDGNHGLNTGGRYNPTTDTWVASSTGATVPSARLAHSTIWTGTEMIVWGGQPTGTPPAPLGLSSGGRYTPATDSWIPTAVGAGVPDPRVEHSAVWTGSEMVVWGGSGGTWLNSGARYNPIANSWAATSMGANVPPALQRHSAVWTGREMIVWGIGSVRTGARYDPITDSWRAMATGPTVPRPAYGSPSVWTGKEMIVWGSGPDPGGRYNPSTDSWATISTGVNAPAFRFGYVAVWTGSELVVQGGCCDTNTGGRYNPSTDSWIATSTGANVPSKRELATGVWTGSEMVVWGGATGDRFANPMNAGGRYDPTTDSWAPISMGAHFPSSRVYHSAVWTGTQMVVWGGDPGTATGGLYCACPTGQLVYRDADGDGLGDPGVSSASCDGSAPMGYVLDHTDCNDAIANAGSDFDNDGVNDACDLDDELIYEWRDDKTSVSWQAEQGATAWNAYIGDLDVLKATGVYTQAPGSNALAARQCGVTGTSASETSIPAPGKASFSLVTSVIGGIEGSLGSSSIGPRPNVSPCP